MVTCDNSADWLAKCSCDRAMRSLQASVVWWEKKAQR
ncbi:hypothetical protein ACVWZ4_000713 [Bradyrhizobium sp. USDA 4472]